MTIQILDDTFATFTGAWSAGGAGGYGPSPGEYHYVDNGGGASAAWAFSVASGIAVDCWVRWVEDTNRGHGITYKLHDGNATASVLATVVVDQSAAPAGFTGNGFDWLPLGTVTPTGTTLTLTLENTPHSGDPSPYYAIADAARIDQAAVPPLQTLIVDDADGAFSTAGSGWSSSGFGAVYGATYHYCGADATPARFATWSIAGLASGRAYSVAAIWPEATDRAKATTFKVYDGDESTGTLLSTLHVDQTLAPSGILDGGFHWKYLAAATPTADTLTVVLVNTYIAPPETVGGTCIADAIRVTNRDFPAVALSYGAEDSAYLTPSIRPGRPNAFTFKWRYRVPGPGAVAFTFSTPVGTLDVASGTLADTDGATLVTTLSIPVGTTPGSYALTATPDGGYAPLSVPFVVEDIPVKIHADSLRLSPTREVLTLVTGSTSGDRLNVYSVEDDGSITYEWDGPGDPGSIVLTQPLYSDAQSHVSWRMDEHRFDAADDEDATPTGTWLVQKTGYPPENGLVFGGTRQATLSTTATLSYPFSLNPGVYSLLTSKFDSTVPDAVEVGNETGVTFAGSWSPFNATHIRQTWYFCYSADGVGTQTATWTLVAFPGVPAQIYSTWDSTHLAPRGKGVTYTVYDAATATGTPLGTFVIDQSGVPSGFVDSDGFAWTPFGATVTPTGTHITIVLSNTTAAGDAGPYYCLAEAVRSNQSFPGYCPDAKYEVYDGVTLLGTLHDDQAAVRDPVAETRWTWPNTNGHGGRVMFRELSGTFTVPGAYGDAKRTIHIVLSNGDGSSTLTVGDALLTRRLTGYRLPANPVNPRLVAPDAWATVIDADGVHQAMPVQEGATVATYRDDSDGWKDYSRPPGFSWETTVRDLKLGWNKGAGEQGIGSIWRADQIYGMTNYQGGNDVDIGVNSLWTDVYGAGKSGLFGPGSLLAHPTSGDLPTVSTDHDGEITAWSGGGFLYAPVQRVWGGVTTPLRNSVNRPSGTFRIEYFADDPATVVELWEQGDETSHFHGTVFGTPSAPVLDVATGKYVRTQTYTHGGFDHKNTENLFSTPYSVRFFGKVNDLCVYEDNENPAAWTATTRIHKRLYRRCVDEANGNRPLVYTFRNLDAQGIADIMDGSDAADLRRDSRRNPGIPSRIVSTNLVAVHPCTQDYTYFSGTFQSPVVILEVESTAGFTKGGSYHPRSIAAVTPVVLDGRTLAPSEFPSTAGVDGKPAGYAGGAFPTLDLRDGTRCLVPIDDTHFLAFVHTNNFLPFDDPWLVTVDQSYALTGLIYQPKGGGMSDDDLIELANKVGAGWHLCCPHGATTDYMYAWGARWGAGLNPGLPLIVEFSNECWNATLGFDNEVLWARSLGNQQGFPIVGGNFSYPAIAKWHAGTLVPAFRDGFASTGGDPALVEAALMGHDADTQSDLYAANWIVAEHEAGRTPPVYQRFGCGGYRWNTPLWNDYPFEYKHAFFNGLSPRGVLAMLRVHDSEGGSRSTLGSRVAACARIGAATGTTPKVTIYEESYEHLDIYADDESQYNAACQHDPAMMWVCAAKYAVWNEIGVDLAHTYMMDQSNSYPGVGWMSYTSATTDWGTGAIDVENVNPFAPDAVSQIGGAHRYWMQGLAAPTGGGAGLSLFGGASRNPLFRRVLFR